MPTVIFAVRPDGSLPQGWPARVPGSATIVGFRSDGGIVVEVVRRWQPIGPKRPYGRLTGEEALVEVLGPDGSVMPGWPRRLELVDQYAGAAVIDAQGRLRIARREWSEGACGPAIRTVYSTLDVDGDPYPGWPTRPPGPVRGGWGAPRARVPRSHQRSADRVSGSRPTTNGCRGSSASTEAAALATRGARPSAIAGTRSSGSG